MSKNIAFLLVVISVQTLNVSGYYWRNWNGTVPHDAFVGAVDARGPTYIGKVWLPYYGLFVGQLLPGQTQVQTNWDTSSSRIDSSTTIEVLCSDNDDIVWIGSNTTLTTNILQQRLKDPVVGGRTAYYGLNVVYIGKYLNYNSNVYIGNVHTDYYVYWVDESGSAGYSSNYELLVTTENINYHSIEPIDMSVDAGENPPVVPLKGGV